MINVLKHVLTLFLAIVAVCFVILSAAASAREAEVFVEGLGKATLSIINSSKAESVKEEKLTNLFEDSVDIDWIGKFVLGRYWREATDEQKQKYLQFYRKFLINSYVPKFKQYTDEELEVRGSKSEYKNEFLVETYILTADNKKIKVDYKVRKSSTSNKFKIFDVIAEGVSLITTQRSEFGSIVSRSGIDFLIEKLEAKVKVANKN